MRPGRRWVVTTAIAVVCVLAAPAAGAVAWRYVSQSSPASTKVGTSHRMAAAGTDPSHWKYVALGDSYTAGPLIPFVDITSGACLRSSNNYPHVLAAWLGTSVIDVSCSGARTSDMTSPQSTRTGSVPPQLDALTTGVDLVTAGIGGNDFGLYGSITRECVQVRSLDPTGYPCRRHFTVDGVDTKLRDARRVGPQVADVVAGIRSRAPHARIIVLGYPQITDASGGSRARLFADGDSRWTGRVEATLNSAIRQAAVATGASYVDLNPSTRGHSACAGKQAWVNGPVTDPFRAYALHPFFTGMLNDAVQAYQLIAGKQPTVEQLRMSHVTARQNQAAARIYAPPTPRHR